MIVTNKSNEIALTPEQKERIYWDNWVFESHKWIEFHNGYYTCEFCNMIHTAMMPISNHNLCKNNPKILEIINK